MYVLKKNETSFESCAPTECAASDGGCRIHDVHNWTTQAQTSIVQGRRPKKKRARSSDVQANQFRDASLERSKPVSNIEGIVRF